FVHFMRKYFASRTRELRIRQGCGTAFETGNMKLETASKVNVVNVGERCKLQCSPLKLLKSKARVNVVNVVQRFFASRARNPKPIPAARGYPRKVPGIHLGYPRQSLGFARGLRWASLGISSCKSFRFWDHALCIF